MTAAPDICSGGADSAGSGFRDRHSEVRRSDVFGSWSAAVAGLEFVDGGELVGCEFEVEDVEVLGDPFGLGRLGMTERPC
ncbi:hypothetical protein [Kribbella jejuensis]|uniref:hypothetical protein n=1 Tax=Kribbella jejuensis TaxID=236068 RepID=UPI0016396D23|nr:hypothetical protein [Kribbella jejuensis]